MADNQTHPDIGDRSADPHASDQEARPADAETAQATNAHPAERERGAAGADPHRDFSCDARTGDRITERAGWRGA